MTDVTVSLSAMLQGDRVIIVADAPIVPTSALQLIPRRPDAPDGVYCTLRVLSKSRTFVWIDYAAATQAVTAVIGKNGQPRIYERPQGYQFDVFGFLLGGRLAVVYTDTTTPGRFVVTAGFFLQDVLNPWP